MKIKTLTITFAILLLFIQSCQKDEDIDLVTSDSSLKIFVKPNGDDSNSGLTYNNAVLSLKKVQEILYQLSPETDITVIIDKGTYYPKQVTWTFTNDKKIIFTAKEIASKPIFDGSEAGHGAWFVLKSSEGKNTNLNFKYLKIQNFLGGVTLRGDRDNKESGWNGNNHFYEMHFHNIGSKYTSTQAIGYSAVGISNSRNNSVVNCTFTNIENNGTIGEERLIHAIYLSHYASENLIVQNKFVNNSGGPIRTRDESNFNIIKENSFIEAAGKAFYSEWYCDKSRLDYCTKPSGECESYGNEFLNNDCNKGYRGEIVKLIRLYRENENQPSYCAERTSPRVISSGNILH